MKPENAANYLNLFIINLSVMHNRGIDLNFYKRVKSEFGTVNE